jgi:hypothetical protein
MECHGVPWNVPSMGFCRLISLKLDFLQWLSIWFKLSRCFKFDAQVSSMCRGYRVFLVYGWFSTALFTVQFW